MVRFILSIFSKFLALLHNPVPPPSPEVTIILLIVIYNLFFLPRRSKRLPPSKPVTLPFLSWQIKKSYSVDCIFQRSQQVCHFLKSIMSLEQETLSLIALISSLGSTEFQWWKVCHKHTISHTLLVWISHHSLSLGTNKQENLSFYFFLLISQKRFHWQDFKTWDLLCVKCKPPCLLIFKTCLHTGI